MAFRGGMTELMRQASRMQRRIEKRKEEMKTETVEAASGGGKVKAVVNGGREVVSIDIGAEALAMDKEMLQDLVVAAVNAALAKANEFIEAELEKITGGVKIPGMF
jgi:hypothetical protein